MTLQIEPAISYKSISPNSVSLNVELVIKQSDVQEQNSQVAKLVIKFLKLRDDAKIPQYAHSDDAGMDLFSLEQKTLNPGERHVFLLGIAAEIPYGYFISVRDKSGVASKFGIHTMAGVIDSGFRGEWGAIMVNASNEPHVVEVGDKIAQAIMQPVAHPEVQEVTGINTTERGVQGFGSTGRK